jgi:hypothetical protein
MGLNLVDTPLIDRPDFEDLLAAGRFGPWEAQARQMHQQGYCLLDLDDPQLPHHCQTIIATLGATLEASLERWRAGGPGPRLQDAWQRLSAVRSLALQPSLLHLLAHLYGRSPFPFQTLNFPVGSQQHFHSDAVHFHSFPHGFMCGVWIALEPIQPGSGPLVYYPGSHRLPYLSAQALGLEPATVAAEPHPQRFFEPHWRNLVASHGFESLSFLPVRGQALVWHANLLHGGLPVADRSQSRWSQVTHYFFADCLHTTPMHSFAPDQGGALFRNPLDVATGQRRFSDRAWQALGLTHQATVQQDSPQRSV